MITLSLYSFTTHFLPLSKLGIVTAAFVGIYILHRASQVGLVVKNPPVGAEGDVCVIPVLGRCPGGGQGNPLQCSCLENLVDRGASGLQSRGRRESDTMEVT